MNIGDYFCKNKTYQNAIKSLEKEDIFVENLESFEMAFCNEGS
jgi:hypothetical protein